MTPFYLFGFGAAAKTYRIHWELLQNGYENNSIPQSSWGTRYSINLNKRMNNRDSDWNPVSSTYFICIKLEMGLCNLSHAYGGKNALSSNVLFQYVVPNRQQNIPNITNRTAGGEKRIYSMKQLV